MRTRLLVLAVSLTAIAIGALAETPPPFVGTWKMNADKSTFSPGPPPKSRIDRHEAVENGIKVVTDVIDPAGKPVHTEYTAKFDGNDYPFTVGRPGDTISVKKIDDYTMEYVHKIGKLVFSGRNTYSRDGKLRTLTMTGTSPKGQKIDNTIVLERQ